MHMKQNDLISITSKFKIKGTVSCIEPLGDGLINTTYKVTTKENSAPNYVLQLINNAVFPDVDMLMGNIVAVTNHIRKKLSEKGQSEPERHCLEFIPLANDSGKYYFYDGSNYWRIMVFIEGTVTKSEVSADSSYTVGLAFGDFESMLADIPVELGETIKDFHNMEFRLQQLREAVEQDKAGRAESVKYYIDEIERRAENMTLGERLFREGKLKKRICHCDTKVNNMLFDAKTDEVLCVIDLDTVMPNFVFSDFGDFLRTAANSGKEDDENLDNVNFKIDIFEAFARGYLKSAGSFLTETEINNLPYATALFPYMQTVRFLAGMRFLADYLEGDIYFATKYPEHNLVRTKAQFKLLQSVEEHYMEMKAIISSLSA